MARQKWWAISAGTIILLVSYWLIVFAFVASETEDAPSGAPALAFGLALVPMVFVAVAAISRRPELGGSIVAAMLLFVAVGLPATALARDAVSGLVAGFGAGGVVSLRREAHQGWRNRAWGVVAAATFTLVAVRVVPALGLIAAPIITLPSIGVADIYSDRASEQHSAN